MQSVCSYLSQRNDQHNGCHKYNTSTDKRKQGTHSKTITNWKHEKHTKYKINGTIQCNHRTRTNVRTT